jgi:hypothetical protein
MQIKPFEDTSGAYADLPARKQALLTGAVQSRKAHYAQPEALRPLQRSVVRSHPASSLTLVVVLKRVKKDDKLALSLADDSPDCALSVVPLPVLLVHVCRG